jgi:serine/threonine protein phosphatase PrpC
MSEGTQLTLPAVDIAERSDPGRDPTKQINEDAYGHRETRFGLLAVVCDGMGGHVGGLEASTAAVASIFEAFDKAEPGAAPRDVLRDAIRLANARVRALTIGDASGGRPGSTVVAVLVHGGGTEVAHVGDSRVFLVQEGKIFQVTRDHSMVQEMVQAKLLTPDQAAAHPDANKITRALGIDDDVDVEVRSPAIAHVGGDAFVLCSDGLSDLVDASEILQIVSSDPPAQAAGKLVDLANARGGYDNITVVIVRPHLSAPAPMPGAIAPTRVSTMMTVRPPGGPPLVVIPPAPLPAPSSVSPADTALRAAQSRRGIVLGAGIACVIVAACLLLRLAAESQRKSVAVDAGPTIVRLGVAPSASIELSPSELPEPVVVDASGVAPLEPVPTAPAPAVRHSRGHPPK